MKKTKIVCTVGPSTDKEGLLEKMMTAGMDVARFNFSHGNHDEQAKRIKLVRKASANSKKPIALLADTKGPEMRLGLFENGSVNLETGDKFILTSVEILGTKEKVGINYPNLPKEVNVGDKILLSDGLLSLQVDELDDTNIYTTVLNGGTISSRKRVAVPGAILNLPFLSEADILDIKFAVDNDMDYIAASFVQKAADVLAIRKILEDNNSDIAIISKIENSQGIKNIKEIIAASDGIMVARGDLGVEIPTEDVPIVQKSIIKKCNKHGKPVITATQMLESMMNNPRPTRAEASDIANAILDGSDAIMLSGETASGEYPLEAVETMSRIAQRTEAAVINSAMPMHVLEELHSATVTESVSKATVQMSNSLKASAIISSTATGYTSRLIAKYRPDAKIVALTPSERVVRRMQLYWGVLPMLAQEFKDTDAMVLSVVDLSLQKDYLKSGDLVIITAGTLVGTVGSTNMVRVHVVGNILLRGIGIGKRVVRGNACVINKPEDFITKFRDGDIAVLYGVDDVSAQYATNASAIIAEEGGLTSHAAIVGLSFGIPTIVGVEDAMNKLLDGMPITVDAERGVVYHGHMNI